MSAELDKNNPPLRKGTLGWKQFLTSKLEILDAYDSAKTKAKSHEVVTDHGRVAEAEVRKWLSKFLPGRYGVTSGYVVSQGIADTEKLPHFDVIIYDQLESPVLWTENSPDLSPQGASRAIPAEFVYGVFEVKSAFNTKTTQDAITHLLDLKPLMQSIDQMSERYKKYLPQKFFCEIIFIELRKEEEFNKKALNNLISPGNELRGYHGGVILRGAGLTDERTGLFRPCIGDASNESTVEKDKESLISGSPLSDSKKLEDKYHSIILLWSEAYFARFAFDIIALLNGSYDNRYLSSFHGMNWKNPDRNK